MLRVGVCGFPRSQEEVFSRLDLVEVQKTFYKPMRPKTAEKWRKKAGEKFEFTVKAWQLITHPAGSPTYRKAGLSPENPGQYGFFKPTKGVFEAWEKTREICQALRTRIVVFQSPPSFKPTPENIGNMEEFFLSVEKSFVKVWEPRGWPAEKVGEVCNSLGLVHAVDPFAAKPTTSKPLLYYRLHGSPPGKRMYNYSYTEKDLEALRGFCPVGKDVYILFNNIQMFEDSIRFKELVGCEA